MPRIDRSKHSNPRKSPKQARSAATVVAVVEAAARILEAEGFAGFSTNAVAERAGVSIGSLYQYFPDKEALLWALIERETSLLLADAELAETEPTGETALTTLIRATVGHQLRRPALARLLDFEEARQPADANLQRVASRFASLLANVLARPDMPTEPDLDMATRDIMAIIKGMIDAAGAYGETDQADLAARVQRAVVGYISHRS